MRLVVLRSASLIREVQVAVVPRCASGLTLALTLVLVHARGDIGDLPVTPFPRLRYRTRGVGEHAIER
jgi:hypothetical protein